MVGLRLAGLAGALALAAAGASAEPPPDFCSGQACTAAQRGVWGEFQRGAAVPRAGVPALYSGACTYASPYYDPNHVHHGVAVFDERGDDLFFGGEFSFFAPANPYAGLTLQEARGRGLVSYDDKHRLTLLPGHAEADLNPGKIPIWRYWFRQSPSGETLTLLAHWDVFQRVFCSLTRHHPRLPSAVPELSGLRFD